MQGVCVLERRRSLSPGLCLLERSQGEWERLTSYSREGVKRQEWLRCWSRAGCSEDCRCRFSLFLYTFHFLRCLALWILIFVLALSLFFLNTPLLFFFLLLADFHFSPLTLLLCFASQCSYFHPALGSYEE